MDKRAITDTTTTQAARLKGPEPKVERVWEGGTMLQKSAVKRMHKILHMMCPLVGGG